MLRKFIISTAIISICSILPPEDSFAQFSTNSGFYVRGGYTANFLRKQEVTGTEDINSNITDKTIGKDAKKYEPEYDWGHSGSIAFGYSVGGPRIELEFLMLKDEAKGNDFDKRFYLMRNPVAEPKGIMGKYYTLPNVTPVHPFETVNLPQNPDNRRPAFIIKNTGFTNKSVMANAYYDIDVGNSMLMPYVGGGIGGSYVQFADSKEKYALSYQLKAGVTFSISSSLKVYAGYRYFGIVGNEYKEVKPEVPILAIPQNDKVGTLEILPISTTATIKHPYGAHGIEGGIIILFNGESS